MTDTDFLSDEEINRLTPDQQRSYHKDSDAAKRYWAAEYRKKWGEATNPTRANNTTFAWIMILIGLGIMFWGLIYDPSLEVEVPSMYGYATRTETVVNIGEATKKIMIFVGGGVSFLYGCILLVGANIISQISAQREKV